MDDNTIHNKDPQETTQEPLVQINTPFPELRSFEMKEFLERPPNWWLRSGTATIFFFVALFFLITWWIKFPEKLAGSATIIADPPSEVLVAPHTSQLSEIKVENGGLAKKDQALLVLEKLPPATESADTPEGRAEFLTLKAPFDARMYYFRQLEKRKEIVAQDSLLVLIPEQAEFHAVTALPRSYIAKLKIGQKVIIKLRDFSFMEFGAINGVVNKIYPTVDFSNYQVEIALPNQLRSSYDKELSYTPGMQGQADIIIKEQRLIEQLLSGLTKIFK